MPQTQPPAIRPPDEGQLGRLHQRLARQTAARVEAERIGEEATRRLFLANQELERTNAQLRETEAAARAALREKQELLAVMSHEMRTPLGSVAGTLALLEASELGDEQRGLVRAVRASAEALQDLLTDVLQLSRLEMGRVELRRRELDILALVEEVTQTCAAQIGDRGLQLGCLVSTQIPRRLVGDPQKLRQVVLNLLTNALKFSDAGEVLVRVRLRDRWQGSCRVRFEVSDSGPGIADGDLDRLFRPFSQLESAGAANPSGSGLGLWICRQLVELMGGQIGVEGELGGGCTFWFEVPLQDPPATKAPLPGHPALGSARVLLAEDNEVNRFVMTKVLESWGCRPVVVVDGCQAVAAATASPFDIILMDAHMPGTDGIEATAELRRRGVTTPIVALTGAALEGDRERMLEAGMNDHITKPIPRDVLEQTMLRWIPTAHVHR